jgi:uroporphyrinogen decarboxylase
MNFSRKWQRRNGGAFRQIDESDPRDPHLMTSSTKTLLRVLSGRRCSPPPIWLMRQAGRYLPEYRQIRSQADGFLDFCLTPALAVEATLQPIRRYGLDAAILFSDILVIPHALGQKVSFVEGSGPQLEPLENAVDLAGLSADGFKDRLAPVFETLTRLRQDLPDETTLIGFAGAPWTVASYMVEGRGGNGFPKAKRMAYADPGFFRRLIDLLVETTAEYLCAQIEAGAEALQIFDSWAGNLAESELRRWSLEPLARIMARLKARHPDVPVILFPRGAGTLYAEFARILGVAGLSLDNNLPLAWAAAQLQPHVALQGNLDPILLAVGGEAMRREIRRILETLGRGPLVFNLGHGIVPETPPEHVSELVEMVRGWRG